MFYMEKVAIVILTYNSGEYLYETIASSRNQSYKNIEVIIVDDCSKDGTVEYLNSLNDVVVFFNKENKGIAKNLNFVMNQTDAEYMIFLGHDDILPYTHVEKMLREIKIDNEIALVHCNALKIDSNGSIISLSRNNFVQFKKSKKAMYYLALDNFIQSCGLMIDRSKFIEIGGWDENYKLFGEWLTYIKLAKHWKIHFSDKTHGYYRVHEKSTIRMIGREQKIEIREYKKVCRDLAKSFLDKKYYDLNLMLKRGYRFAKENLNYK